MSSTENIDNLSLNDKKKVLHVGCGPADITGIGCITDPENWIEHRLDIDPNAKPDYCCSMLNMYHVPKDEYDLVFSSHCLEHVFSHEVRQVLWQFERVLKPGGIVMIYVPNLQQAAQFIVDNGILKKAYTTEDGNNIDIYPIDMIYGWVGAVAQGHEGMQHKTGFTPESLKLILQASGFINVAIHPDEHFNLMAAAQKPTSLKE